MGDVPQRGPEAGRDAPVPGCRRAGRAAGVVAIGETREFQRVFDATAKTTAGGVLTRVRAAWRHVTRRIDSTIAAAWFGRAA